MVYWKRLITLQLIVWFAWNFCEAAKYDSNYAWMWVIKVYKNPRWWTTAILEIVNLSPVHLVGILGTVLPFKSCFYLLRGFGAVGGQKSPPPLLWPLAYMTYCTIISEVTAVVLLMALAEVYTPWGLSDVFVYLIVIAESTEILRTTTRKTVSVAVSSAEMWSSVCSRRSRTVTSSHSVCLSVCVCVCVCLYVSRATVLYDCM